MKEDFNLAVLIFLTLLLKKLFYFPFTIKVLKV